MESEGYIKEKQISNMPTSVPYEALKILITKLEKNICKIECTNGGFGTGFFCNIPNGWNNTLKALLTNNHVLNKDDTLIGKIIKFSLNNGNISYEIKIDSSRKRYTSEKYDITIIEIREDDKLNQISFFDIDNQIFDNNSNDIFKNMEIYLLHYPKGVRMEYSNGLIKSINEDHYTIRHLCPSSGGSSGSPIINAINFQVIGIHKGGAEGAKNYNLGTFLKEPLEEFNKINDININNINNNKNESIITKGKIKDEINENKNKKEKNETKENKDNEKNDKEKIEKENNKKEELLDEDNDEILIKYKIDNNKITSLIIIFGPEFVKNYKDKCKIIIKGEESELFSSKFLGKNGLNNDDILEIRLKGIKKITNMREMFSWCSSFSVDMSKWNTKNVTDMSFMFSGCKASSLPDISNLNTQNVTRMDNMFNNCLSLVSLPDISKWDTQKVDNMSSMFFNCSSLSSLPDISKWNTQNVKRMDFMFSGCVSLTSLPEISKWNTQKLQNKNGMFQGIKNLNIPQKFKI